MSLVREQEHTHPTRNRVHEFVDGERPADKVQLYMQKMTADLKVAWGLPHLKLSLQHFSIPAYFHGGYLQKVPGSL